MTVGLMCSIAVILLDELEKAHKVCTYNEMLQMLLTIATGRCHDPLANFG